MKYLTNSGLSYFLNKIKAYISSVLPTKTSDLTNDSNFIDSSNLKTINNNSLVGTGNITITANTDWNNVNNKPSTFTPSTHTHSASDITSGLATVATSGSYNDLSNKPTIPTVNNATLTIQKNGSTVKTFTANASSNVTANITVPTKTSDLTNDSGFLTSHQDLSGYIPRSGGAVITGLELDRNVDNSELQLSGATHYTNGASVILYGKDFASLNGMFRIRAALSDSSYSELCGWPSGVLTWYAGGTTTKHVAMQEDVVPRSGGAVLSGGVFARNVDTDRLLIFGGDAWSGSSLRLHGGEYPDDLKGSVLLQAYSSAGSKNMVMYPSGTWTWNGTACQLTSDQRLKQQISEIDDKLLDAWEDVEPVQFKYNDAVDAKKDKARLHTGYVVQQIDTACKSHNVDISEYGLYCHEKYPEETEEVEVENEDGTKVKERKVIREASEHYSLRYTEVYAVECMYLRRENSRLKEKLASIEERLEKLEKAEK